jgi:hypothetical protein
MVPLHARGQWATRWGAHLLGNGLAPGDVPVPLVEHLGLRAARGINEAAPTAAVVVAAVQEHHVPGVVRQQLVAN